MSNITRDEVYAHGQGPTDKQTASTNALIDSLIDKVTYAVEDRFQIKTSREDFTLLPFNEGINCFIDGELLQFQ